MEIKINPKIEKYIEPLNEKQFEKLKRSIKEDGLLTEIEVMPDGTIVDGHHRYKACKELGIKPRIKVLQNITTVEQAIDYTYKVNILRRQMNKFQIAEWAYKRRYWEEREKALERKKRGLPSNEGKAETAEKIAEEIPISRATFERALKVLSERRIHSSRSN